MSTLGITLWRRLASAVIDFLMIWPILAAWRILKPFVHLRLGPLHYGRIGHLAGNTEFWLRVRILYPAPDEHFIFFCGEPANHHLLTMIKRRLRVWDGRRSMKLFQALKRRVPPGPFWVDLFKYFLGGGTCSIWERTGPQLRFTRDDHRRGRTLLRSMGIEPGESYVCFHARDKQYLAQTYPYQFPAAGWGHHDYRDCDINNFLPAAETLAERGIWALRVGSIVEKSISPRHARVVDYASTHRSEFGDIYLLGNCKFFIGNTAGPFIVSTSFHVPVVWTNVAPIAQAALRSCDLFIPKKFWHAKEERMLTYPEVIRMGADLWGWTEQFDNAGIRAVENTPEEILDVAMEMNARLDGDWTAEAEDEDLQARFRALFPPDRPLTGYCSRVGAGFLRKNRHLLDRAG